MVCLLREVGDKIKNMEQENKNNDGMDLGGELNDSDTGVKFQDSGWRAMKHYREPETPKIIQWVIKYSGGLVKDNRQANYVLLGLVSLFLVITIILFSNAFSGPSKTPAGYRGNIPDLPEYRDPPTPQNLR